MKSLTEMGFDWSTLTKRAAPAPRPKPKSLGSQLVGAIGNATKQTANAAGKAVSKITGDAGKETNKAVKKVETTLGYSSPALDELEARYKKNPNYTPSEDELADGWRSMGLSGSSPAPAPTSSKSFMDYLNEYKLPIGLTGLGLGLGGAGLGYYMHRKKKKKPYEVE